MSLKPNFRYAESCLNCTFTRRKDRKLSMICDEYDEGAIPAENPLVESIELPLYQACKEYFCLDVDFCKKGFKTYDPIDGEQHGCNLECYHSDGFPLFRQYTGIES